MDDEDIALIINDLESDPIETFKSIEKDLDQHVQTLPIEDFMSINKVGQGTFGEVFKVKEKKTNKIYALKRLKTEKEVEGVRFTKRLFSCF